MSKATDAINEQIHIEGQKTANILMYALENDKKYNCKAQIGTDRIHVMVLIGEGKNRVQKDQSWDLIVKRMKPEEKLKVLDKIAVVIGEYTEQNFAARKEDEGILDFRVTAKGLEEVKKNLSDRAASWLKRFLKNEDVSDWCRNRIFVNGFPESITVFSKSIVVEGKARVIFDVENYDDLKNKEEILGMAQCISQNGGNRYIVDMLENELGISALLTYTPPKVPRKQW